jgi:xanthine dehydrogenase accessory factor
VKGAGELASAAAWRLFMAGFRTIFMMEVSAPLAVRREVAFCEAVYDGSKTVEGVEALRTADAAEIPRVWERGKIALIVDPGWQAVHQIRSDVLADAIMAKRNLGTRKDDAKLVIGLGPGFVAGEDVHFVIETRRGHDLGRVITAGSAEPNTGIPEPVGGFGTDRVLRAPSEGEFRSLSRIGDHVVRGAAVGRIGDTEVISRIAGVLRGLIRTGTWVTAGLKIGDIDPRGDVTACFTISDKARAIAGAVLEAVLRIYNR